MHPHKRHCIRCMFWPIVKIMKRKHRKAACQDVQTQLAQQPWTQIVLYCAAARKIVWNSFNLFNMRRSIHSLGWLVWLRWLCQRPLVMSQTRTCTTLQYNERGRKNKTFNACARSFKCKHARLPEIATTHLPYTTNESTTSDLFGQKFPVYRL